MTGKQLHDFYDISSTSLEFQHMPPCLSLLVSVKNNFERIQNSKVFVTLIDNNDRKVLQCVSDCLCNDYHYVCFAISIPGFPVYVLTC